MGQAYKLLLINRRQQQKGPCLTSNAVVVVVIMLPEFGLPLEPKPSLMLALTA